MHYFDVAKNLQVAVEESKEDGTIEWSGMPETYIMTMNLRFEKEFQSKWPEVALRLLI